VAFLLLTIFVVFALIAAVTAMADAGDREALAGHEVGFLGVVDVYAVNVRWIGTGSSPVGAGDRILYLGSHDGVVFLLDFTGSKPLLVRAPAGSVVLSSEAPGFPTGVQPR
jgi:hypothetical protein